MRKRVVLAAAGVAGTLAVAVGGVAVATGGDDGYQVVVIEGDSEDAGGS